jgi:phosphoserine phosphatase RsbU/P
LNPSVSHSSLSPTRILSAALCLGVLSFTPSLKSQTKLPSASATAAQPFDATNPQRPVGIGATGVFLGEDNPVFARADYDDSRWLSADAKTPIHQSIPNKQPEIIWQRIHVKVSPSETGLGIQASGIARAFEIYVNGEKLLGSGQVSPLTSFTEDAQPVSRIPDAQIASGHLVIAIRERSRPSWWTQSSRITFLAENITLGQETALADHAFVSVVSPNAFSWFVTLMGVGLCVVSFALFFTQRQQKEYLWLALQGVAWAIGLAIQMTASFRNIPVGWYYIAGLEMPFVNFFTILMVFAFVRQKFRGWLRIYIVVSCFGTLALSYLTDLIDATLPSWLGVLNVFYCAPFIFVVPAILVAHLRRGNREERILLIPVITWGIGNVLYGTIAMMYAIPGLRDAAIHLNDKTLTLAVGPFVIDNSMVTTLIAFVSLTVVS